MKIVYVANDGTEFNDYNACELYELAKRYTPLITLTFYDKLDNPYHLSSKAMDILENDWYYNNCEAIYIPADLFELFIEWAKDCGYAEFYEDITEPGYWKRYEYLNGWKKLKKMRREK